MSKFDALNLLGTYFGESALQQLPADLQYEGAPEVKMGERNAAAEFKKDGLEITFTLESALDVKQRDYPDGSLVVSNFFFHGEVDHGYTPYKHEPPFGISFGMNKKSVEKVLGEATWTNPNGTLQRWDRKGHCATVRFSSAGVAELIGCQLPNRFTHK